MERPAGREPGVVDQHVDAQPERPQGLRQLGALIGLGQVGGDHLRPHPVIAGELGGELAQPLLAARDEHDAVAGLRELAGELRAEPRGGAGDERDARRVGSGEAHQAGRSTKASRSRRARFITASEIAPRSGPGTKRPGSMRRSSSTRVPAGISTKRHSPSKARKSPPR